MLDHLFCLSFVLVDVDPGHFVSNAVALLLHALLVRRLPLRLQFLLVVFFVAFVLPVVLLVVGEVDGVVKLQFGQNFLELVIHGVAVALQTVDHQSESLDTVLDPHLGALVQFSVCSAQTNQRFIGSDSDGKNFVVSSRSFVEVGLPKQSPKMGEQVNCVIGELRVYIGLAVCDVPPEVGLCEYVLGPGVRLVDVVFLVDLVLLSCVLLLLFGVDDVLIVLIEGIIAFRHFGGQSVVAADSLADPFVLLCAFLVEDDEDEVEAGEEGVRHADVFGGGHAGLVFSIDGIGGSDD